MLKTIKTVLYTLMSVFIIVTAVVYDVYAESKQEQTEIETQEIVDTLEKILVVTKPDFEQPNNQTFINSVGECVNYIYHTTTDIYPVNFEVLLKQLLESGWGNSRFALEAKIYLVLELMTYENHICYLVIILKMSKSIST